jgi:hypothetical protein
MIRPSALARVDGWVRAWYFLGCGMRPATSMAPPPLDSIPAPASVATSANRRMNEPRGIQGHDPNESNLENERRDLVGSATYRGKS